MAPDEPEVLPLVLLWIKDKCTRVTMNPKQCAGLDFTSLLLLLDPKGFT